MRSMCRSCASRTGLEERTYMTSIEFIEEVDRLLRAIHRDDYVVSILSRLADASTTVVAGIAKLAEAHDDRNALTAEAQRIRGTIDKIIEEFRGIDPFAL